MDAGAVRAYYAAKSQHERDRLLSDEGLLERVLTTRLLEPHLGAPGRALDLGGGTGPYSVWLAELGWDVSLADLSPELLAIAASSLPAGTVREVVEIDARDLSRWGDHTFDAVLSLGPMYHLTTAADRDRAARELARVTRPGGLVAVALMPRYVSVRRLVSLPDERWQLADPAFLDRLLDDGVLDNAVPDRFTHVFGVDPAAVTPFFESYGFSTLLLASTHGFLTGVEDGLEALRVEQPAAYTHLLDRLVATAGDPSVLGTAGHLLYVGRLCASRQTRPDS
ncbi:class I SAM-dependent methyltransferase [Cellulomonas sp. ICMP 17802]|uniref:class I SAM-dependent methyltransferase n=1 Tax=Cellulomonas sp. ICMP 17802 TaxID=3239199 RepID=UPI00351BCBB3